MKAGRIASFCFTAVLAYLALVITYWILHAPIIFIICCGASGAAIHLDYDSIVATLNHIVYYPLWHAWYSPELLFHGTPDSLTHSFWWVLLQLIGGVMLLGSIAGYLIVIPVSLFRFVFGVLKKHR